MCSEMQILFKHKIAYKRVAQPSELFTHPKNRSGMGLNSYNVHKNLACIATVGHYWRKWPLWVKRRKLSY